MAPTSPCQHLNCHGWCCQWLSYVVVSCQCPVEVGSLGPHPPGIQPTTSTGAGSCLPHLTSYILPPASTRTYGNVAQGLKPGHFVATSTLNIPIAMVACNYWRTLNAQAFPAAFVACASGACLMANKLRISSKATLIFRKAATTSCNGPKLIIVWTNPVVRNLAPHEHLVANLCSSKCTFIEYCGVLPNSVTIQISK